MASSFQLSPGVYFNEQDLSQYVQTLSSTIVGMVGVASRGLLNVKTLCTSYSQLISKFGFASHDYPALLAAREFYAAGGTQLWFVRVARGDEAASASVDMVNSSTFTADALTTGSYYNTLSLVFSNTSPKTTTYSHTQSLTQTSSQSFTLTLPNTPLIPGSLLVDTTSSVKVCTDDANGNLVFAAGYTNFSGTVNYVTGVLSITVASEPGAISLPLTATANYWSAFQVQVVNKPLDVNGNPTGPYVFETWGNLTPSTMEAGIAKSNYFTISANPTSWPVAGNYTFSGGDDGKDDVTDADFVGASLAEADPTGLQIFAYPDQIDVNTVCVPGVSTAAVRQALDQLCSVVRRDSFAPLDPYPDDTVQSVVDLANSQGIYSGYGVMNSTYTAFYYPWFTSFNNVTSASELTPPTAAILAALAQSDYFQAPAGPNRGVLLNCLSVAQVLNQGDRDFLYANRINPIGNLSGLGIMILGQKTSTLTPSALDRVVNRIILMRIEKAIVTVLRSLLFEPDTQTTWNRATNIAQPYLDGLVNQGRLLVGKFTCNATTNTTDLENENVMAASVTLTFAPTAEEIMVTFIVTAINSTVTEIPGAGG